MARAVVREKEKVRAILLTLLASVPIKSWTCQLVTYVENLLKIKIPLSVISVRQKHIQNTAT